MPRNNVTLRAKGIIRGIERLYEHAGQVRTVRRVAVQAAPFFSGVINGRLVLERKRALEFVVAVQARTVQALRRESLIQPVQRFVALAARHYAVVYRMPVRIKELTPHLLVATVTQLRFPIVQKAGTFVVVDFVTCGAVDVVFRVDVVFAHSLLVVGEVA